MTGPLPTTAPLLVPPPWAAVAEQQDGVLSRRQARLGGLSEDAWQWQLDSERWQSLVAGVAVTHRGPVTDRQRAWAALLCAGPGAALSGDAALRAHGLRLEPGPVVDVAVPEHRVVRRRWLEGLDGVRVRMEPHRVRELEQWRHPSRTPSVVGIVAAVLHAAAWAPSDRAAELRVAMAVQQRLVRPGELRAALQQVPRLPRRGLLRAVLDDVELGAHARTELDFLAFLRRYRLPAPDRLQRPVRAGGLRYLDAYWERQRVAAELDGAHHRLVGTWEDDLLRSNAVAVAERHDRLILVRFTRSHLRHAPDVVARQLGAVLL